MKKIKKLGKNREFRKNGNFEKKKNPFGDDEIPDEIIQIPENIENSKKNQEIRKRSENSKKDQEIRKG